MRAITFFLLGLLACRPGPQRDARVEAARLKAPPRPQHPKDAVLVEPDGGGRVRYLGWSVAPATPRPGEVVELSQFFEVQRAPSHDAQLFLHGEEHGQRRLVFDHAPIFGALPTSAWKAGDLLQDRQRIKIPGSSHGQLSLWVGLFRGERRWTVEAAAGKSDGEDRIRAGRLRLSGPPLDLPKLTLPKVSGKISPDGRLDEPGWEKAARLSFSNSMSGAPARFKTELYLMYDAQHLYAAFRAEDQDITERYKERDDPIYEHESVELFLMPHQRAPATGPYVELQASPGGVIFDAAFTGPRQNMDKSFNGGQQVGTAIEGSLNDPREDTRWVSEWAIPWSSLRGVSSAPKPGEEWRMNAFRIEKYREGGRTRGEYTAWSPPKVGDFHRVERFGRLIFGP